MVRSVIRPQAIAVGLLVLATGLLWSGRSLAKRQADGQTMVPATVGPWAGSPVPMDPKVFAILETNDVSMMEYKLGVEPPVYLAQVAGFGNRAAFHPPELCYVGSHFEVLERERLNVNVNGESFDVMRLLIGQGPHKSEAWYWFTANGRVTPNYYQQQAWLILDTMRRKPVSGTLVRISTNVDEGSDSRRRLLTFLSYLRASTTANAQHNHSRLQAS